MRAADKPRRLVGPPARRHEVVAQPHVAPPSEMPSGEAAKQLAPSGDVFTLRRPDAARIRRREGFAGLTTRCWLWLALLALLPRADAPSLLRGGGALVCGAPVRLAAMPLSPAAACGLLALATYAARCARLALVAALSRWRSTAAQTVPLACGVLALGLKRREWHAPRRAGRGMSPRWRALLLAACALGALPEAQGVVDSRMYTRMACPTVKHRWLAASQYLSSTTWSDGVQSGAQDAVLACNDAGISKPFYDQSSKSVLFSPRSQASTTGPYVNLQSVHFGTGDFTFLILAKYNAPGSQGDNWPRIFDFSTTGNSLGTYFILTEVRARAQHARLAPCAAAHNGCVQQQRVCSSPTC